MEAILDRAPGRMPTEPLPEMSRLRRAKFCRTGVHNLKGLVVP
jgi:hypothetical protein